MSQDREYPGNLPLLPMGWGAANLDFDGAENFWEEVQRVTAGSSLGENLDIALAGESSPRIWLFLHEPGHGALTCAAALEIARELGARDQAALILDCDDTDSQLTRWAGRHESEGWIDLVRYGASVLTSGVAIPFEGRRGYILGVGSFTPTDVEAQEAEDLINRLKRQADDLILVAPANETGKLWARLADIRLLCWDRARKSAELIDRVCSGFEETGYPLTGLVGFGLPEEGMMLGDKAEAPAADHPVTEEEIEETFSEEDSDDRFEADDLQDVDYTDADGPARDDLEEEDGEEQVPLTDEAGESAPDPVEEQSGSGSSRVFWGAAIVSLLLIAVVSFYYLQYVRPVDEGSPSEPPVIAATQQPATETMAGEEVVLAEDETQGLTEAGTADDQTIAEETQPAESSQDQGQPMEAAEAAAPPADTPPADTQPEVEVVEEPVFSMDPYLQAVGSDGWALHLYSFPDSNLAVEETQRLERRGFQTAIRPVEFKDKGRWYRVYVGSFMTKSEAREAQDPLMKKLKVDWARATEF